MFNFFFFFILNEELNIFGERVCFQGHKVICLFVIYVCVYVCVCVCVGVCVCMCVCLSVCVYPEKNTHTQTHKHTNTQTHKPKHKSKFNRYHPQKNNNNNTRKQEIERKKSTRYNIQEYYCFPSTLSMQVDFLAAPDYKQIRQTWKTCVQLEPMSVR